MSDKGFARRLLDYLKDRRDNTIFDVFIPLVLVPIASVVISFLALRSDKIHKFLRDYNELWTLMAVLFAVGLTVQIRSLGRKVNAMLEIDLPLIISDSSTIFAGSKRHPNIPQATRAKEFTHQAWREVDKKHMKVLRGSKWVSHTDYLTDNEEIVGGDYGFLRMFDCPVENQYVRAADLYLLVDDECIVSINGQALHKVRGFDEPHYYYLRDYIQRGPNELRFTVYNDRSQTRHADHQNTYGLRFCLAIRYVNP